MILAPQMRYLDTLASLVCDIDIDKNEGGTQIKRLMAEAISVVAFMKMDRLAFGELENILYRFYFAPDGMHAPDAIRAFIEAAHAEIERLSGARAPAIYSTETTA